MPTAGIPHRLLNFSEFQKYMRTLQRANTIESIREVWWDFRPHIGFGTVEVRVCDNVPTLKEMVQIAALSQCLVVALSEHYDTATQFPTETEAQAEFEIAPDDYTLTDERYKLIEKAQDENNPLWEKWLNEEDYTTNCSFINYLHNILWVPNKYYGSRC